MNPRYMNINQIAQMSGLDRRTITSRLADIEVHEIVGKAKFYDMHRGHALIARGGATTEELDKKIQAETYRLKQAQADKLVMQVAKLEGELVAIEDVCAEVEKEYTRVRSALLSIPSKLAKLISMEGDPAVIKQMLDEAVSEALEHLTQDKELQLKEAEADVEPVEQIISDETEGIETPT